MGDNRYLASRVILDASPLIYLAKLEALDVLTAAVGTAFATPTVLEEVTRPQVAYRHPDAVEIEAAVERGTITRLTLGEQEIEQAASIRDRVPGLHPGESEVLAVSIGRRIPAVIFERRARRVASSLGAELVDIIELLVAGTASQALREQRLVRLAGLVNMRLDQTMELLARIGSERSGSQVEGE